MPTNRLPSIRTSKERRSTRITLNLVRDINGNIKLLGHMRELAHHLVELLLTVSEFAAAAEVDAEAGHDTVDYEKAELVGGEVDGEVVEELELVLGVEGAAVDDVVEGLFAVDAEAFGDLTDSGEEG